MAAANTDNFTQVSVAGSETTMAAPGKTIGASSINLTSATGWPTTTGIILAMRRVDTNGNYVAGTYTEWAGVLSGTTITLNTTPLYGNDQSYAADGLTQVFQPVSSSLWNRVINTLLNQHTQAGAHVGMTNSGGANFTGGITTDSLTITGSNVSAGWTALGQTLVYSSNSGNKEFVCTCAADLRSTLSAGMKLQVTRNTVPSTQAMAFVSASSQYATKASPAGLSFTSAFSAEAWVYLNGYTGANQTIISRRNGSVGAWWLRVSTSGQIGIGYGDGSGNFTEQLSYESVPLNKWVHIAGAVSSVSSKTAVVYLNGRVSAGSTASLGAATALVQSGNLSIGCYGAGSGDFLNGYASEVRVWSVAQSQAAIQSNMAINLVGSESNLVALFSDAAGTFNDSTSNANNLTATGGAVANQAANPYNPIEYAEVVSLSYSNPTTTVTLRTPSGYTIPNQTLNSAQYSTSAQPYGWPQVGKIPLIEVYWCANQTNTATTAGTALTGASALAATVPTGGRKLISRFTAASYAQGSGVGVLALLLGSTQISQYNVGASSTGIDFITPYQIPGGSQNFSIQMWQTGSGTNTLGASTTQIAALTIYEGE